MVLKPRPEPAGARSQQEPVATNEKPDRRKSWGQEGLQGDAQAGTGRRRRYIHLTDQGIPKAAPRQSHRVGDAGTGELGPCRSGSLNLLLSLYFRHGGGLPLGLDLSLAGQESQTRSMRCLYACRRQVFCLSDTPSVCLSVFLHRHCRAPQRVHNSFCTFVIFPQVSFHFFHFTCF